jgi:proteasome lid subunit RPN8/RPN11
MVANNIGETAGLLWIEAPVWYAIMRAAKTSPSLEVMGVGHASIDTNGVICMDDMIIPEQEVTPTHVDISGPTFMKLWDRLAREYKEKWHEWCIVWHSHCSMGTSPSGTDTRALAEVVKNNLPFAVSLVVNVKGEHTAWAETTKPFTSSVNLEVMVDEPIYPAWDERVDEWMKGVKKEVVEVMPFAGIEKMPYFQSFKNGKSAELVEAFGYDMFSVKPDGIEVNGADQQLLKDFPTFVLPNLSQKAVRHLNKLVDDGDDRGIDICIAERDDVPCCLAENHLMETKGIHVGLYETNEGGVSPAYFTDKGTPSVKAIRKAGLPV